MTGIINYGAGNIFSLTAALNRLNIPYGMINQPVDFDQYDRYIIPGVGHAGAAMQKLNESKLIPCIRQTQKPVLGICVGMQLLTEFSEEGNSNLTGIFPLKTLHFKENKKLKVPHTGWNQVSSQPGNLLFRGINNPEYFYFVHSFFIEFNTKFTSASAEYGIKFSAAIQKNNFYGVQFHPEKSGAAGEQLLTNFSNLT
ncbi:MAG TPA: imidazole glycerol phosphate synthase subunit HisH [Daejeonella sp.]|nr:imidazole glycerol phosphate synthase subunit HisH [Daejeonella sp.]